MRRVTDRWTEALHVPVPGWGERVLRCAELVAVAERLVGGVSA